MKDLTDTILEVLAKSPTGAQSVSHLVECLRLPLPGTRRCYGPYPNFPSNHSRAMDEFEKLGFTVREGKRRGTYEVTL